MQDLPEDFLIQYFISGLRDVVKYDLIAKPTSTIEAMRLVRVEKEKSVALKRSQKSPYPRASVPLVSKDGTSSSEGDTKARSTPTCLRTSTSPIKLTPQEIREKSNKGICFYCDKKYIAGHKCRLQKIF